MAKKEKKKWSTRKKVIVSAVGVAVVGGVIAAVPTISGFIEYERIISEIEVRTPDLQQVADGTYNGFFDAIQISADVDVTVEDHKITDIVINEHHYGYDKATAAEAIVVDVVDRQTLDVDTYSGATNSSKVILSAVQLALESGIENGAESGTESESNDL